MDINVQRLLNDKIYDKRKQGAFEYVHASPNLQVLTEQDLRNLSENVWPPKTTRGSERSSISFVTSMPMPFTNLTLVMVV